MAWDYTQTGDPGSVGVGRTWLHPTTGVLKVRNTANTAWTTIGNVDDPSFGSLLTSGGAVSANITGNTGWAASDAHNFPTTASINSVAIATINDVTSRISALEGSIIPLISSAIATYAGSLTFSSKIATACGLCTPASYNTVNTFPFGSTLQYSGGDEAKAPESKWVIAPSANVCIPTGLASASENTWFRFRNSNDSADVNPNTTESFLSYTEWSSYGGIDKAAQPFSYFILAMRP